MENCANEPFFCIEKAEEKVVHKRYPILIGQYGKNDILIFN